MKLDALYHRGKKSESGMDSAGEIGSKFGDSRKKVYRYIRLSYLTDEWLKLVDQKKINITGGEALSYLSVENQAFLYDFCKKIIYIHPSSNVEN